MKKLFALMLLALALAMFAFAPTARADSLACPPPAAGTPPITFYYITGMPAGTVATYTAALPGWFTGTGGLAMAPDSTGATGYKFALPANWPAAGMQPALTGTEMACNGVGCSAAVPFAPPSAPGAAAVTSP